MSTTIRCLVALVVVALVAARSPGEEKRAASPSDIFDGRILPIFRSPKPSSCVQCHLSSVDLKNYILPSAEKTFVSLRDQGLIDIKSPENSKILTLIRMGEKDLDKGARLIHAKMRLAEYEAFKSWIKACCDDPRLIALPKLVSSELAKPSKPDAVIRHTRKSRLVDSFRRNIWTQRMRCFPCHTPFEINPDNARHKVAIKNQKKFKANYPELVARLPIFKKTPEETLNYLIKTSRKTPKGQLPLLNLKNPRQSLLILKPTSKLPKKKSNGKFQDASSVIPVSHMGGLKMHRNDLSYKAFVAWIQDYAKVVDGRYATVDELPADNWQPTRRILKLFDTPEAWKKGTVVQLFLHSRNKDKNKWNDKPIAFTQGVVNPRHRVAGPLFLFKATAAKSKQSYNGKDAKRPGNRFPRGPFLIKVYVDSKARIAKNPTLMLSKEDFYGRTVLNPRRWRIGFRQGKVIRGESLKK